MGVIGEETIHALEWERVLQIAAELAASPLGAERLLTLEPPLTRQRADLLLTRTQEMVRVLTETNGGLPMDGLADIREALSRASIEGASLDPLDLRKIAETLTCINRVRAQLASRASYLPELSGLAHRLWDHGRIAKQIEGAIDLNGDLFDDASPDLKRLRQERRRESKHLEDRLGLIMQKWADQGYLQDSVVNYRDGKLVLPVRDDAKHKVQGVMVDTSASGATVFLEPVETLPISNKLRQLELEEKREIHRILLKLTALVFAQLEEIALSLELMSELDELYARARLALRWEGVAPELNDHGVVRLWRARHPLLLERVRERKLAEVVPLTIEIVPPVRSVVISGPNAGGKTVALKTVGLLSLLANSGFFIPASSGSQMCHFATVWADIGDAQSLEGDLSTFTGHVARLRKMTEDDAQPKLLLVDEIGSSTDPAIGAALAQATLLEWTGQGAVSVVTTHHGALKAFAHETEGLVNGSMAFDEQSLVPTYLFREGLPGSSYALEIAQRVGFPERVLKRARGFLDRGALGLEELVSELSRKIEEYEKLRQESDLKLNQYEALAKLYEERTEELKRIKAQARKQALAEAEQLIDESRVEIEQLVKVIKEQQAERASVQAARDKLRELSSKVSAEQKRADKDLAVPQPERNRPTVIEAGLRIAVDGVEGDGVVTNLKRGGKQVEVEMNGVRLWFDSARLYIPPLTMKKKSDKVRINVMLSEERITGELDLRGKLGDEAVPIIDRYLTVASSHRYPSVKIIHGKGTGALRVRVREFLQRHPLVKHMHDGGANQDDFGSTVVELY
ncbi:MAG: endonuclease MutS2 [bacterium]|nr:endonuclease MutS2 [bacterium]MBK8130822.1 endonuclease MutS2 [bacterium]